MNPDQYRLSRISPTPEMGFHELALLGNLDPYGQHRLLWKFFDLPRVENPKQTAFLFRSEIRDGLPLFYLLSGVLPKAPTGAWRVESKEYRPALCAGDRLVFSLRANPVNQAKQDRDPTTIEAWAENRKQKGLREKTLTRKRIRHDVVMDAKRRMNWDALPPADRPPLNQIAYDAGCCWLRQREAELGCEFGSRNLKVDGHRVHRMRRRRGIVLSTLDFEGELRVTDPAVFLSKALFTGIGPAKAFGCGLLLVRRLDTV